MNVLSEFDLISLETGRPLRSIINYKTGSSNMKIMFQTFYKITFKSPEMRRGAREKERKRERERDSERKKIVIAGYF